MSVDNTGPTKVKGWGLFVVLLWVVLFCWNVLGYLTRPALRVGLEQASAAVAQLGRDHSPQAVQARRNFNLARGLMKKESLTEDNPRIQDLLIATMEWVARAESVRAAKKIEKKSLPAGEGGARRGGTAVGRYRYEEREQDPQ